MAAAVTPPNAPRAPHALAAQPCAQDPQQRRQAAGQPVGNIIQMGGSAPEIQILFVFIAHHAVHGVDAFIAQRQRCAAQQHIQQGGDDAIGKIFGHGFHSGLGHPLRGEGRGIAPHNAAHRPARRGQVLFFQLPLHGGAFGVQPLGGQRLPAPHGLHQKPQRRMQRLRRPAHKAREQKRAQGQHRRQHAPCVQKPGLAWPKGAAQGLFQRRNGPAHPHHRVRHPGRVPQQKIQPKAQQNGLRYHVCACFVQQIFSASVKICSPAAHFSGSTVRR